MPISRRLGLPLASALLLTSCLAGPHQLKRSLDDWDQRTYVNSPWWSAVLWITAVMPVGYVFAWTGDFLITDPWVFWFDDAWDGAGTGFEHVPVQWTDGRMASLLFDRAGWTRVER